jgi:hypothetical protein
MAALWPGAAQRRRQPPSVIGALQVAVHLAAELALCDRVLRMPPDINGTTAAVIHGNLPGAGVWAVVRARAGGDGEGGIILIEIDSCHWLVSPEHNKRFAAGIVPHRRGSA